MRWRARRFDDDGNPVNAYAAEDGATGAHNLIEEFALIVNRMAATLLVNSGDPRLQRLAGASCSASGTTRVVAADTCSTRCCTATLPCSAAHAAASEAVGAA